MQSKLHNSNRKQKYAFLFSILVWKFILDYGYQIFVFPLYSYAGFDIYQDSFRAIESYVVVFILALLVGIDDTRKPSVYLLLILYLTAIVPASTVYSVGGKEGWIFYSIIFTFLVTAVCSKIRINKTPKPPINGLKISVFLSAFLIVVFLVNILFSTGFRYFNLDIERVYDVRAMTKELHYGSLFGYINGWATKVVPLVLLTYAIAIKNTKYVILCVLMILALYGFSSHKTVLFAPFLLFGVKYALSSKDPRTATTYLFCVVVALALAVFLLWDYRVPSSLLVRRALLVPSFLNYSYYEFFSVNGPLWFSNSFLSAFNNYEFNDPAARVIGGYLGRAEMNANTGYLATAYMQMGFLGLPFYGLIVGLLLSVVDRLARNMPAWIAILIVIGPFKGLFLSADLFTSLLTHGLFLSIVLLWLSTNYFRKR